MSKYLTEFDEIQAAFRQVRLDENCMVYRHGMLLENQDTYNKIQKLLKAPEMCEAHKYLYDLDVECLSEDEIARVDKLFDLGVKKGYIDNSFEEELDKSENPDAIVVDEEPQQVTKIEQYKAEPHKVPVPCWTVLYSATKNGETKCGECYSNAISVTAAKTDCISKLERFGYENISILAIEATDADCVNMTEDDLLKNRHHNLHITEAEEIYEDDDEGSDEGSDEDSDNKGSDEDSDDNSDDEGSDEDSSEDSDDNSDDEGSDEDSSEDSSEDSDNEGSDEDKELSDEEKATLKDEYKTIFREVMVSCKFEGRSFMDLTIPEKVQFFSALNVKWTKNDPKDFMSEDEQDQLESIVINPL